MHKSRNMSGRPKKSSSKTGPSYVQENITMASNAGRRKRKDTNSSEEDERTYWTPKHLDLKAYNRLSSEAPAELFRKDLISAMKLADNEPLTSEDFWGLVDQWKQEWERGVQVPVNPDSLPEPTITKHKEYPKMNGEFRLSKRYLRVTHSDFFNNERHILSNVPTKAEKMCRYDMDNLDTRWLRSYNGERSRMGAEPVPDQIYELIIEHLEETCWENIHQLLKADEPLSIEYDEDVICDVCRSPDSEEGNEMVFCDTCNICVHQACYGITAIPSGSWLCRTCSLGIKPNCDLCPNKGGAMKSTKSGHKWAHVACALWIPEVSIGSVERMEPITKINNIPQSRWGLVCVLCRGRVGACIQCSVRSCKTAYHVTCAFRHGLEMKAIIEDEHQDDVKLRSYCEKHSRNKKDSSDGEGDNASSSLKKKKDLTSEQRSQAKAAKLRQIESEFYKHVDVLNTSRYLDIDLETTETIFYFWKLKRKSIFNKPLLTPRSQELDILTGRKEQNMECLKLFVQLRQYLERARNLAYMTIRREKMSKSFIKLREQTFIAQVKLLSNKSTLSPVEVEAIMQANHGPNIYDQLYSHPAAPTHTKKEFDDILKRIEGKVKYKEGRPKEKPLDINGIIKKKELSSLNNPYRKSYFNGAEQRRSRSKSICGSSASSTEDSDSSLASTKWNVSTRDPNKKINVFTSSEDEQKNIPIQSHPIFSSPKQKAYDSSEDDKKMIPIPRTPGSRGRGRGVVKRKRGRPPKNKDKIKLLSSDDDKRARSPSAESKNFDALMKSTMRSGEYSGSKTEIKNDSSDIEPKRKVFSPRVAKSKIKNFDNGYTSSDEDASPSRPGRGRGRGRGRKNRGTTRTTVDTPLKDFTTTSYPWMTNKVSDDDLAPATYKLTSDEDEKSLSRPQSERSLSRPPSEESGKESEGTTRLRKSKSHSDLDKSDEESVEKSHSLRTKGAVKELPPKTEPKTELPEAKKKRHRPGRPKKSENIKEEKVIKITEEVKDEPDLSCDLNLFVPQRAAAKKASERITSQNNNPAQPAPNNESELRKGLKSSKESTSETESLASAGEDGKKSLKSRKTSKSDEEPPKKNIFEVPEILPYVPIREAARKAAENLKGNTIVKTGQPVEESEPVLKLSTPTKKKSLQKGEKVKQKSRSPRSSSKGSTAESDSDDDASEKDHVLLKPKSLFSESDEESPKKIVEQSDLPNKNQLFRGDFFGLDHQSSSEDELPSSSNKGNQKGSRWSSFTDNECEREAENKEPERERENEAPTAETRRKGPDKKLKTSDGRPEHGFQPPVTQREESSQPAESSDIPSSRQSRLERRKGIAANDATEGAPKVSNSESETSSEVKDVVGKRNKEHCKVEETKTFRASKRRKIQSEECSEHDSSNEKPTPEKSFKSIIDPSPEKICKPSTQLGPEKGFKSTFQCITDSKEETPLKDKSSLVEKEMKVKKLDDIMETDYSEVEPKNTDIVVDDSDDVKEKVEQPKDSGYKSTITTPEPSDIVNTEVKGQNVSENSTPNKKVPVCNISPLEKNKLAAQPRKKNLQDVIEERLKVAEIAQAVPVPVQGPTESGHMEGNETVHDGSQESNEATASSFVENWRNQFEKSPPPPSQVQMEHTEQAYQSITHPHAIPTGIGDFNPFYDTINMYENYIRAVQYQHYLAHQLHINAAHKPLEDVSKREDNNLGSFYNQSKLSLHDDNLQRVKIPPQNRDIHKNQETTKMSQTRDIYLSHDSSKINPQVRDMKMSQEQSKHQAQPRDLHLPHDTSSIASQPRDLSHDQLKLSSQPRDKHLPHDTSKLLQARDLHLSHETQKMPPQSKHLSHDTSKIPSQPRDKLLALDSSSKMPQVRDMHLAHEATKVLSQTRDSHIHSENTNNKEARPSDTVNTSISSAKSVSDVFPISDSHSVSSLSSSTKNHEVYVNAHKGHQQSELSISHVQNKSLHSHISEINIEQHKSYPKKKDVCESTPGQSVTSTPTVTVSHSSLESTPSVSPSRSVSLPKHSADKLCVDTINNTVVSSCATVTDNSVVMSSSKTSTTTETHSLCSTVSSILQQDKFLSKYIQAEISTASSVSSSKSPITSQSNISSTTVSSHGTATTSVTISRKSSPVVSSSNSTTTPVVLSHTTTTASSTIITSSAPHSTTTISQTSSPSVISSPVISSPSVLSPAEQTGKRIPIYMQDAKPQKPAEKFSPRTATSPRWPPKERKRHITSSRGKKNNRARGNKRSSKYASVPKQLKGTVYDFDEDDEFDDGPDNSSLDTFRSQRKRDSVDSTPQRTPDPKESPKKPKDSPKESPSAKRSKDRRVKRAVKEDTCASPLKISSPSPLRDPLALDDKPVGKSTPSRNSERKKSTPKSESVNQPTSYFDNSVNQLKLKIKGPYAKSFVSNCTASSQQEPNYALPVPPSATSNLRRMRKKELILAYCKQDMNTEPESTTVNNPPPQRAGITIPKAVASMPHIPTREDYKKYNTQEDSRTTSGRRKKPRELKQLDWTMDKKRPAEDTETNSRKRQRTAKERNEESTKIIISMRNNSPEISTPDKEINIKGKPPKKRHANDMLQLIKKENLQYRDEIMKDFENNSGDEKHTKRRKICVDESSESKIDSSDVKVRTEEASNKLVLKISKKSEKSNNTPRQHTHPLKIRLNLASINKNSESASINKNCESENKSNSKNSENKSMKITPLKIVFQRRPDGYVTSNCNKSTPIIQGPGPPPDQPKESPERVNSPSNGDPLYIGAQSPRSKNIENRDRESLAKESEAMYRQLEARLAASDALPTQTPPISQSFTALPVPTGSSGCR